MRLDATKGLALLAFSGPVLSAALPNPNSLYGQPTPVDNRTLDEIYAAAKNETGELIVLWGGDEVSQGESTIAAWRERFPDIKLNLTVDVSKYHDSRVNRQFQRDGSDGADIAVLQTLQDFGLWKRAGRLMSYKPHGWEHIYSALKDPEGAFLGAFIYQFGDLVYNKGMLNESQVPSSFADFADPKWKSKLVLTYPNDDDAITYLFSTIIGTYGWDWFDAIMKQDVQWVRGTGQPGDFVAENNNTRVLSFTTNLNGDTNLASKTPDDARLFWPQTGAIFATTTRPESAKLFMSWLISDEYQQGFVDNGSYLVRKDLNSSLGSVWDDDFTGLNQFATFMENRAVVESWKLQFETSLGTAQGVSPVLSAYGSRSDL